MLKLTASIIGLFVIIVSYQNCSDNVAFKSNVAGLIEKNGEGIYLDTPDGPIDIPHTEYGDIDFEDSNEGTNPNIGDDEVVVIEDEVNNDNENILPIHPGKGKNPNSNDNGKKPTDQHASNSGDRSYICITAGSGKSMHIKLDEDIFVGNNTPKTLCMSRHACEKIISQKYDVIEAAKRGYCPNKNPHVINLSDEEIDHLVNNVLTK